MPAAEKSNNFVNCKAIKTHSAKKIIKEK